ncbi:hypothetical protein BHE74_00022315, partial [Ensete ventricosum]
RAFAYLPYLSLGLGLYLHIEESRRVLAKAHLPRTVEALMRATYKRVSSGALVRPLGRL